VPRKNFLAYYENLSLTDKRCFITLATLTQRKETQFTEKAFDLSIFNIKTLTIKRQKHDDYFVAWWQSSSISKPAPKHSLTLGLGYFS